MREAVFTAPLRNELIKKIDYVTQAKNKKKKTQKNNQRTEIHLPSFRHHSLRNKKARQHYDPPTQTDRIITRYEWTTPAIHPPIRRSLILHRQRASKWRKERERGNHLELTEKATWVRRPIKPSTYNSTPCSDSSPKSLLRSASLSPSVSRIGNFQKLKGGLITFPWVSF